MCSKPHQGDKHYFLHSQDRGPSGQESNRWEDFCVNQAQKSQNPPGLYHHWGIQAIIRGSYCQNIYKYRQNQDSTQQCGLKHTCNFNVRGHTCFLLKHPHGIFLVHETPPQNLSPRSSTTVQPEGDSCRQQLCLHGNQEGNYRTQTGREASQQPPDQKY